MPHSRSRRNRLAFGVAAVVAAAVVAAIVWGFARQLVLAHQMQVEEQRLEQAVAAEQARYDELVAQLEYVRSDEYVEHWARAEARMARPGETAVVVVAESGAEQPGEAQPTPPPPAQPEPFWVTLWELALGRVRR